ncbi:MAG: 5'-nucleotidase C-terminal domain-containing protein [Prevotella sp.]|nr:5'-nucleotidase C-terminal domain-containing protein [Prevotella sp.]
MTKNQYTSFLWTAMFCLSSFSMALEVSSCRTHYQLTAIERTRILVDSRYDATPDADAATFLSPYKAKVDSIMSPVVGSIAKYMAAGKPESELSNLLSDILVWGGKAYNETPDLGVYNVGGIRAAFAKGKVTYGDVMEVAPFENKICFLTLTGEKLLELFQQIAKRGGEGVSHSVKLAITKDGKLQTATIHGNAIDPNASYRIATLDYLAQGNDGLVAFKDGKDVLSPQTTENNVRFIIMDFFREQEQQGKVVDANKEGRIIIVE